jgi:hypothetical protein
MSSITSANAILMLAIPGLFNVPAQIQQFSAEDIFTTDPIPTAQVAQGVDGVMTAGFVFNPVPMGISLMADSVSNVVFDQWNAAQRKQIDTFYAQGTILLRSVGQKFSLVKGALTSYPTMPNAARTLQPRRFQITWQSVTPQNIAA